MRCRWDANEKINTTLMLVQWNHSYTIELNTNMRHGIYKAFCCWRSFSPFGQTPRCFLLFSVLRLCSASFMSNCSFTLTDLKIDFCYSNWDKTANIIYPTIDTSTMGGYSPIVSYMFFVSSCGSGGLCTNQKVGGSFPNSSSPHVEVSLGKILNLKLAPSVSLVCEWLNTTVCSVYESLWMG